MAGKNNNCKNPYCQNKISFKYILRILRIIATAALMGRFKKKKKKKDSTIKTSLKILLASLFLAG